jgi:hypothetical protein
MKKIEDVIAKKYISEQNLPERKRTPAENYIDWGVFGANEAQRWISVDEEKPPTKTMLLVKIDRGDGKTWTILAEFIPAKTVYAEDFFEDYDEEYMEYDESEDMYYVPETWVECSYFGVSNMFSAKVIEWRLLERS